jgi:hypothetical protein
MTWTPEETKQMEINRRGAAARQANQPHQPGIVAQEQYNEAHPSYNWGNWLTGGRAGWGSRLMGWWDAIRKWFQQYGPQLWSAKKAELEKMGISLPVDILSNLVTGKVIEKDTEKTLPEALARAQLKVKEEERQRAHPAVAARNIQLAAADPMAKAYLERNKAKILKIMTDMEASGKL